jgi:hypothetical protein
MANFIDYTNATELFGAVGTKLNALSGAYVVRPKCTFANLPSVLTVAMTGYAYNVTDNFTTDSRFVEGIGKKYSAGSNVVVVNDGDASTPSMKFDVIGNFVDVDAINNRIDSVREMISDNAFDSTSAYAIGDIVTYEDGLYKFKAAHTANTDWDSTEVDAITVIDLIDAAEPDSLTTEQLNALLALLG